VSESGTTSGGEAAHFRTGLIVAMTPERLIGRDGDLPWHYSEDLKHFKRSTLGHALIMGRRCYESIGRPLPRRTNIVVSASQAAGAGPDGSLREGVHWFGSLSAATAFAARSADVSWFAGGAVLYRDVLATLDGGAPDERALDDGVPGAGLTGVLEVQGDGTTRSSTGATGTAAPPERLEVTWVPSVELAEGDVLFPYDRAWIESHYAVVAEREGETPGLTFVSYEIR